MSPVYYEIHVLTRYNEKDFYTACIYISYLFFF